MDEIVSDFVSTLLTTEFVVPSRRTDYEAIRASRDPETRRQRVNVLAHAMGEDLRLFRSLLNHLLRAANAACSLMGPGWKAPCPLHVHIFCGPEGLRCPIDLAWRRGSSREKSLCHLLPVVWRLPGKNDAPSDIVRNLNATEYSTEHFYVAYSGTEASQHDGKGFSKIADVINRSNNILRAVGLASTPLNLWRHPLSGLFAVQRTGRGIHLTAHGFHDSSADYCGIVVSPSDGATFSVVTALELVPEHADRMGFAFFNCCELGYQGDREAGAENFHAGFAEAVIVEGACREAICNRWAVSQKEAMTLADMFYRFQPRTAPARAAALTWARRKLEFAEGVNRVDTSWMAPVHIWEHPGRGP